MYKNYVDCLSKKSHSEYSVKEIATENDVSNKNDFPCKGENRLASESFIQEVLRNLTGQVLTIIDASLPDGKQQKAVKDLVRQAFMENHQQVSEWLNDQEEVQEMVDEMLKDGEIPEPVSLEEAIGM